MRRRVLVPLAVGVLALSGCATTAQSMQAAVSDEFRISQGEVDAQVTAVLTGLGQPTGEQPDGLATAVTQRLVQGALSEAKASDLGIALTPAQVQQGVDDLAEQNGGQEALESAALQAGIPASELNEVVRTQLLVAAIGRKLASGSDATAQQTAAAAELAKYSEAIDVQVAPRYGTWDDTSLSIVPGSTVSSPAPSAG